MLADEPLQHVLHALDHLIERDGLLGNHLPPAEREQLAGKAGRAIGGLQNFFRVVAPLVAFFQRLHEQLGVPANRHQQIVEVVRHAAREAADGLHLLRLPQLLVALPKRACACFRSITARTIAVSACALARPREGELGREDCAAFADGVTSSVRPTAAPRRSEAA